MKKPLKLLLWTGVLSVLSVCVALVAMTRAPTPRGVGRPLALAETPLPEAIARRVERKVDTSNETLSKQIDVTSQRLDSTIRNLDLLKTELDAFRKDADARFEKCEKPVSAVQEDLPEVHGFTPSWFVCARCPGVKQESESPGLPFKVVWSEVTEEQLRALGIPEKVGFPCFYWQDATRRGWYFWNDGSSGEPTTMKALEAKWREHQ